MSPSVTRMPSLNLKPAKDVGDALVPVSAYEQRHDWGDCRTPHRHDHRRQESQTLERAIELAGPSVTGPDD
jgi:hypothetical protein